MSDRPYTDADLIAEAARQHHALAEDPNFMGVGEQMETHVIPSTKASGRCQTWDSALRLHADDYEEFEAAQRQIHDLIAGAADVSGWAVQLGADGLEPVAAPDCLDLKAGGLPIVRLHFAFASDMPAEDRAAFVDRVGHAIADHL